MCGIAGFASPALVPGTRPAVITGMLSRIRHRGPDEAGYYLDDHMAMGTVRLAIVDLASGAQPMADSTERYWICFNGELYNHIELREELSGLGRQFRTRSDTEVVLQAWIQWGPSCLSRFNGAFAFAVRDALADELFIARDRYGKRPLFYADRPDGFLFASEMKAFRAHPGFSFALDPHELKSVYGIWTPLPDRTPFKGVRQLPPGSLLTRRDGRIELHTYEELAVDAPPFTGTAADAAALVRDTLRTSVEVRLRSDVEVGVYLSGGLDSSIVARLATDLSAHEVRTFSVEFEDRALDESDSQREVARHLGTRHSSIAISTADVVENFPAAIHHAEVPVFRTALVPMYLLSRHVRDAGIKTILSGEGADEAFLGYSLFRETMLRADWHGLTAEERRERIAVLHPELAHFGPEHQVHVSGLLSQFTEERLEGLFSHELRYQNGRFAQRLLKDRAEPFADLIALVRDTPGYAALSPTQKAQWLEFKTLLAGYLLSSQGERMGLAHGVENRCPFLDPAVVRAAALVNLRFDDGWEEKAVLKEAFRDVLPAGPLTRRKQPYRAPGSTAFREHRPDYLELVLSEHELAQIDGIDPVFAKRLVDKVLAVGGPEAGTKEDQAFIHLLSTAVLNRQFVMDRGDDMRIPQAAEMNLTTVIDRRHGSALPTGGQR
ncbi:asparagine synthase (glutamine-hydrolyzing) [Streptomyces acidiscabies]|uniref:asparagine synthase (glutamine-hydrolyzing) n=1 Tax=Streptomyces acidiscabies TaxID=42234 RepID=A0A0L0JLK3_9ACTN|nr:asparagine synthase (glutamine-hydrolyzing) [Streptomyces acidiscabies]KND26275.1 asparagine synthase [Streptomyces acidiscabies]